METILLTGAAGSVGLEALQELVRRKDRYTIRALERRSPRTEKILRPFRRMVEIHWADLTDRNSLESSVQNVDGVIHLAAIIPPLAVKGPTLTIRKFPAQRLTMDDLVEMGSITSAAATWASTFRL